MIFQRRKTERMKERVEKNGSKKVNRKPLTANGNDHTIKPAANFRQVTGSCLERRMPNNDAPAICNNSI